MFSICVEFLQGRVAAARPADDRKLEWPIEPARLYMALVAAHFESESDAASLKVLEWFERLPPPRISAPAIHARSICVNYVPVNDRAGDKNDPLGRLKQPRHYASGFVGDAIIRFMFDGTVPAELLPALEHLLANVVRIGHSSSLVRCWLESNPTDTAFSQGPDPKDASTELWVTGPEAGPLDTLTTSRMRVPVNGTLAMLERCVNQAAIDRYAELKTTAERSEIPSARKEAKDLIKAEFPMGAPTSQPIKIGTHAVYHLFKKVRSRYPVKETVFDPAIVPLAIHDGNSLGLESTQLACKMLRNALLSRVGKDSPAWISGHDPGGEATREPHLAFVPLAFVGDAIGVARFNQDDGSSPLKPVKPNTRKSFADGHLMGFGLVLPRNLLEDDRALRLGDFLFDELGEPKEINLTLGDWGELTLIRDDRVNPPRTLSPETWSKASTVWATVTPIVLNRHPKADRKVDRLAWNDEVVAMIHQSCGHIGIGRDDGVTIRSIRLGVHGFLTGVPSSRPERGFPLLTHSDGKTRRMQTHAVIEFDQPVRGPVLLGAGRFRGYGLCKPVGVSS